MTTVGAIVVRLDAETDRGLSWLNLALLRLFRRDPMRRAIVRSLRIASILRAVTNVEDGRWVVLRGHIGYAVDVVLFLSAGDGRLLFALAIYRARLIPMSYARTMPLATHLIVFALLIQMMPAVTDPLLVLVGVNLLGASGPVTGDATAFMLPPCCFHFVYVIEATMLC